jgi:site-specific DNA recombinase
VPAYLSRDLVDQARATMASNKGLERKHLAREWELRGLMRCSCGSKMVTHSTRPGSRYLYHYYTCRKRRDLRKISLCRQRSLQASSVEPMIWEFISDLLKNPELIRAGMNALIERKRAAKSREAGEEAAVWVKNLEECARLRSAYQDQQAAGFMTLEELGSKLKNLEETRKLAQAELAVSEVREKRVEELKKDRDALGESWTSSVPEALEGLTGEERNKVYRMLRLEVTPVLEGYSVIGALRAFSHFQTDTPMPLTRMSSCTETS